MADTASRILDMLQRRGRDLTLRRRIGTTNSFTDCAPRGVKRGYRPEELVGGIVQGDSEIIIGNAEISAASWPGPPRKGDLAVMDGVTSTVQAATPFHDGAVPIAFILWVRG